MGSSTSQRIALAARRLLEHGGSEAVSMRRVAKAVGVTPMALYRHFPDRAALLNALANEGFKELAARLECEQASRNLEERLLRLFEVYLEHALENPRLFELMFLRPRQGARRYPRDFAAHRSPTANLVAALVDQGIKSGYFRQGDAWEMVFAMGALSHGLIMLYLGERMNMTRAHFQDFYLRSFRRYIRGIRK